MSKCTARNHTAIYKDVEYNQTVAEWAELVGRSRTHLYDKMSLAESKVVPLAERMQFAIDQKSRYRTVGTSKDHVNVKKRAAKEAEVTSDYGLVLRKMAIGARASVRIRG